MIILVCGYTAAGKSYICEYLAKKLNYKFIHTSYILKQISNNQKINSSKTKMNKGWYESSNLDSVRKKDLSIDKQLDKYLLNLVKKEKNLVLDSWTLPYLLKTKKNILRIWIKATRVKRIERLSLRDKVSLKQASEIISKKDNYNKKHFKELYGFSLGKDLSIFDIVFDTTKLSLKESEQGVYKKVLEKMNL